MLKHSKKEVFVDFEQMQNDEIEQEADEYARNILISDEIYQKFIKEHHIYNHKIIMDFSKENNISPGILVGRLQKDGIIGWNEFSNLITRI